MSTAQLKTQIYDYLTVNSAEPTAKKVRRSLLETAKSLEKMPQRRSILPGTENLRACWFF
jgi:hypothetical protein